MSPRPILKRTSSNNSSATSSHCVHFSSSLTKTFSAHSAAAYDRSPIVVTPNSCALPERGCPGRTYLLDEEPARTIQAARDYHPRALAFASKAQDLPQLIPDISSESDESDSFLSKNTTPVTPNNTAFSIHGLAVNVNVTVSVNVPAQPQGNNALSFLPYSPNDYSDRKRCRSDRERRHDSSRTPDRIPMDNVNQYSAPTLSHPSPKTKSSSKSSRTYNPAQVTGFAAPFSNDDVFGGF